jgi:hypothetical protein
MLNLGASKLAAEAQKCGSIRGLARLLEQDFVCVLRWSKGDRVPEYQGRKILQEKCGIPMDDWDIPSSDQGAA